MRLSTRTKVKVARTAYRCLSALRQGMHLDRCVRVKRSGLIWDLDLAEGIDLSIYLLGRFEPGTQRALFRMVKPGDVVLDVGANIGAHTLPLARAVGEQGRVIAFEPSDFAFQKLRTNLSLNPELAGRVTAAQIMLTSGADDMLRREVYASWPMNSEEGLHENHQGHLTSATHASGESLDSYLARNGVRRVDLVKMDVDGYEASILKGAQNLLQRFRPRLVVELANYMPDRTLSDLKILTDVLNDAHYQIRDLNSGHALPLEASSLRQLIPDGADRNVIMEPRKE